MTARYAAITGLSALLVVTSAWAHDHDEDREEGDKSAAYAVVNFQDESENAVGKAMVREGPEGVLFRLELEGLPTGWKAIHIHEKGHCDDHEEGFTASGGHLDPDDREHGLLNPEGPEIGDLPNIWVSDAGRVMAEIYAPGVSLHGESTGLLSGDGTAVVIHEGPDDHTSQPIGGAGARIACGVVEGGSR